MTRLSFGWLGFFFVENWEQERVKKCRFAISAESALKNFSHRRRMNDDCDAGVHFGSPPESRESIFSHVPVPELPSFPSFWNAIVTHRCMLPTRLPTYIIRLTMPNQETLYHVADRVVTITLNRPDKLNAWTTVMEREVRSAMGEAEHDENVRVIILTGAGRGFCAGADMSLLSTVAEKGLDEARRTQAVQPISGSGDGARRDFQKKYSYFPAVTKPVIAAINGPVVGLGLVIALYCDIRLASDAARFGTAFAQRGLIAEYGMAWMLPRLVGHANALDLLFSARMIDAGEALRMGLVNQVYPRETFLESVQKYAVDLASNVSPRSLRVIKRQVYDAMFQTLAESFESSEQEMLASLQSEDFKEGVAHFIEKRAPAFTGR
jgi:enoyl-CoA hydratase/carnithine racemase